MKFESFEEKIDISWYKILRLFIESEECDKIYSYLKQRSALGKVICPLSSNTWNAFKFCKYSDLKVVMIGYDPYPQTVNKIPVADGLAFSSSTTNKYPDSLKTLYQGINEDVYPTEEIEANKDLSFIAEQGVLMLNYSLTVEENDIGMHSKKDLWLPLHTYLINYFNQFHNGLIYQLFGNEAKKVKPYISEVSSYVLEEYHPSYFARNKKPMNTSIFSQTNKILKDNMGEANKIIWDKAELNELISQCPF